MQMIRYVNLALRFFLELAAWAALGYWGFQTGDGPLMKAVLTIGAPLAAIVLWGLFGAPRALRPVGEPWHLLLEVVVFGAAVPALIALGQPVLGALLGVLLVVNRLLIFWWKQ
jgi:uncharacterized protein DUF2568